jgi:hypothetical protein
LMKLRMDCCLLVNSFMTTASFRVWCKIYTELTKIAKE